MRTLCVVLLSLLSFVPRAEAAGEPVGGFPIWEERVIHQWTNRARVDPQTDLAGCANCPDRSCYSPVPPLTYSLELNRAARFHAASMGLDGYMSHTTPYNIVSNINSLYPSVCNGAAFCASQGSGGTAFYDRIARFNASPSAENIAWGSANPTSAFYLWLHETSTSSNCVFGNGNGHRWNILKQWGGLGAGSYAAYTVQDFGGGAEPSKIVSGTHYPRQASSVEAWANWYDGAAPMSASVNLNGTLIPMTLRRGTGTNGAWSATLPNVGSGTHRYFFVFRDSTGATYTYPSTGSYSICTGSSCTDWTTARPGAVISRGDVNADGALNTLDVFYLLNYVFAGGPAPIGNGDVNSDTVVTATDAMFLISYLFGSGPAPAA